MSDKPTIWVCNDAGHNTKKALLLVPDAEIRPLTVGDVNPLRIDRTAYHISKGIVKHAKEEDYLLLSGYIMVNVLAVLLWLLYFKRVKLLQWHAKKREYELTEKTLEDFTVMLQKELERA